ncbi:EAL domain-containing protein, partial [Congregibacter sp.]
AKLDGGAGFTLCASRDYMLANIPDCSGSHLELEITESVLLGEPILAAQAMQAFRKLGIASSIDDFGRGDSSLAYLQQYPLSRLKIDASFACNIVVDPDGRAIAQTIIALANAPNLEVIAEGVETEEQRAMLVKDCCYLRRGCFFSKPISPTALLQYQNARTQAKQQ